MTACGVKQVLITGVNSTLLMSTSAFHLPTDWSVIVPQGRMLRFMGPGVSVLYLILSEPEFQQSTVFCTNIHRPHNYGHLSIEDKMACPNVSVINIEVPLYCIVPGLLP